MPQPELSIDRLTRSYRNSFTSVRLDRLVDFRDDAGWVERALSSPDTRYLPLWRGRGLIDPARADRPVVYLEERPERAPTTLLGRDSRYCYFACPVEEELRLRLLDSHPGSVFADLRQATRGLHEKHAGILAYAKALMHWQYRHAFCGSCGTPNRLESAGHRLVCSNPACARESFPRIDPAIIVLITHGDACLLGRNAAWPDRRFSTLAGYLEPGESLEDAVTREVYEEARVRLSSIRYVSSQPWPFPSSAMCGFYAEATSRDCAPTEEMEELRWLTAAELAQAIERDEIRVPPPVSIAFRLIADWYRRQSGRRLADVTRSAAGWASREGLE